MAENKTVAHGGDPFEFIAALDNRDQAADSREIIGIMMDVSGQPATMWGSSIVGFGSSHYRYASGREGDTPKIGFSPRKGKFAFYTAGDFRDEQALLDTLGRYELGVGCLYIRKLADVDLRVLASLLRRTYESREPS